jgi:hypothetical protein
MRDLSNLMKRLTTLRNLILAGLKRGLHVGPHRSQAGQSPKNISVEMYGEQRTPDLTKNEVERKIQDDPEGALKHEARAGSGGRPLRSSNARNRGVLKQPTGPLRGTYETQGDLNGDPNAGGITEGSLREFPAPAQRGRR